MTKLLSIVAVATGAALLAARAGDFITVLEMATYDGGRMSVVDAESNPTVVMQGLAVDAGGKIYLSDKGADDRDTGRVLLARGTNEAVTVFQNLARPGDIELRPDQRGLVIALAGGAIETRYFGVSIKVLPSPRTPALPRLYLKTDQGPVPARLGSDGWYHFDNVLWPGQTNETATLILNNGNPPAARTLQLRDPVAGRIAGHVAEEVKF